MPPRKKKPIEVGEIVKCGLCGIEKDRAYMGSTNRSFSIRQGQSRIHAFSDEGRLTCTNAIECFTRAMSKKLNEMIDGTEAMEMERIKRELEQAEKTEKVGEALKRAAWTERRRRAVLKGRQTGRTSLL
jgi:hypothetical protein